MGKIIKSLGNMDMGYQHREHRSKKGKKSRNYRQNIKHFFLKKKEKWDKKERNIL